MTQAQRHHAEMLANRFADRLVKKYEKGAAEHKSLIWEAYTKNELLAMAIEEVIDLIVYLGTLEDK